MSNENEPQNPETPIFDKTLAESDVSDETKDYIEDVSNPSSANYSLAFTSGPASPPSPDLDTEEGHSDWDAEGFTPPTLEEMPKEGPGSPGYDVYAPENQPENEAPAPDDNDEEDVKAALERDTSDGPGETPVDQLPESDVDPNEEKAEDYVDLQPRGDAEEPKPEETA